MNLSILIVSWNVRELLEACLASIDANPPQGDYEVIVVDNCSADGTAEMVRGEYPHVRLVESPKNLGFAGGNNLAIGESSGEYVLLLNPDTEVKPGALDGLVCFLEQRPEYGGVGARLLNADGSLQHSCYPEPTLFREFWRLFHLDRLRAMGVYPMQRWDTGASREVEVLMGACLLLRRAVLDQVGWLDEDFFIYSEEVDLCHRVRKGGWKLAWAPQAQVIHYWGQSTRQVAASMFLQLYRAKIQYFRKNHGKRTAGMYKLIIAAASLSRLLLAPAALFERAERRQQHLAISGNYWRLLATLPEM